MISLQLYIFSLSTIKIISQWANITYQIALGKSTVINLLNLDSFYFLSWGDLEYSNQDSISNLDHLV